MCVDTAVLLRMLRPKHGRPAGIEEPHVGVYDRPYRRSFNGRHALLPQAQWSLMIVHLALLFSAGTNWIDDRDAREIPGNGEADHTSAFCAQWLVYSLAECTQPAG